MATRTKNNVNTERVEDGVPDLNVELLTKIILWAEHDEERKAEWAGMKGTWDQGVWMSYDEENAVKASDVNFCKSAYCVAGQAVASSGYRMEVYGESGNWSAEFCVQQEWTGEHDDKGNKVLKDVPNTDELISTRAREVLGLHVCEAELFFEAYNDIKDLKEFANGSAEVRGLPLLFPGFKSFDWTSDFEEYYLLEDDDDE